MVLLNASEIIGILIVTAVVGYIFSGMVSFAKQWAVGFDWEAYKLAVIISAPAVILHELGHKFVALALGVPALFQVYWGGLALAVILKFIGSPFLIIAPAYVVTPAAVSDVARFMISFAGPFMNLVLWGVSALLLRQKKLPHKQQIGLIISKKINFFLFIFNMIPFPPLDGFSVARSLWAIFSSF